MDRPRSSTKETSGVYKKKEKHRSHKYKGQNSSSNRRRKESPKSSDDETSSEDDSTSTSRSSSTTGSSSSSTVISTSSSSSAPSVKIRHRKKHSGDDMQIQTHLKQEQKQSRHFTAERERKRLGDNLGLLEKSNSQDPRAESSTKRKAPLDFPQLDSWKKTRYEAQSPKCQGLLQRHATPPRTRVRTPADDDYLKGKILGTGNRNRVEQERDRNRIRIVPSPSNYGQGVRLVPSDIPVKYPSPSLNSRLDNRSYPTDFRGGREEKRQMERMAPARTPNRIERIPPLLPECELRRQLFSFPHADNHRGFIPQRQLPSLLPDRRRDLPLLPSPTKQLVPKIEESSVKNRVAEWVGETLAPVKHINLEEVSAPQQPPIPALLPPVEEVLSEISDFEDTTSPSPAAPQSEKEELEVTSTHLEEAVKPVEALVETPGGADSIHDDSILDNMDFEEISDDELDEGGVAYKKQGIADALGVDWSILLRTKDEGDTGKPEVKKRRRETSVVELLRRTGLNRSLVSDKLFNKVLTRLGEVETEAGLPVEKQTKATELERPVLRRRRLLMENVIETVGLGPGSRALSYRRDLAMRYIFLGFDPLPLENLEPGIFPMPSEKTAQ